MRYDTPELVVIGSASDLVQGIPDGMFDHDGSLESRPPEGIALGLDD
jgi:hypothetical protein